MGGGGRGGGRNLNVFWCFGVAGVASFREVARKEVHIRAVEEPELIEPVDLPRPVCGMRLRAHAVDQVRRCVATAEITSNLSKLLITLLQRGFQLITRQPGRFFPLFLRFSIGKCRNCPFFVDFTKSNLSPPINHK